jgi:hypothetical protein
MQYYSKKQTEEKKGCSINIKNKKINGKNEKKTRNME